MIFETTYDLGMSQIEPKGLQIIVRNSSRKLLFQRDNGYKVRWDSTNK